MGKINSTREQEMFRLVETATESELTNKAFCEQEGIHQANFYYWKKKYQQRQLPHQDKFISLQAPPTNCCTNELEICYAGYFITHFMITPKLKSILNSIVPFSDEEYEFIEPYFERIVVKKNQIVLEEGQLCTSVFLVESGALRNYYDNDGLGINLSFTFENQFTTSFEAYINREPSKIMIQAIEKSEVWVINIRDISKQKSSFTNLSTIVRRIAIRVLFATEEHHNMIMMNSPVDRYRYLLEKKPELIQRIPLTHLASYIGITRETLSRIRSNKY